MSVDFQYILSRVKDIFTSFGPGVIFGVLAVTFLGFLLGHKK